jgi:hypothetical protein
VRTELRARLSVPQERQIEIRPNFDVTLEPESGLAEDGLIEDDSLEILEIP